MLVALDERFDAAVVSGARGAIERNNFAIEERSGADDRTLAWIDDVFGGAWSGEAHRGTNFLVKDAGAPIAFATFDPRDMRYAWLRGIAAQEGVCVFGPVGVDPEQRGKGIGRSLLICALGAMRARGAKRALIAAVSGNIVPFYAAACDARIVERFDLASFTPKPVRTVVLASGNGSNFQSVLDRISEGTLPLDVTALVTNRRDAFAIRRARVAHTQAHVVAWDRSNMARAAYDAKLLSCVESEQPELVLLLGWMHVLDPAFVSAFSQLINVHPAFLPLDSSLDRVGMPDGSIIPAFRGACAVRDALEADSSWIGVSVHGVTAETDRGPIFVRKPLRVKPADDEDAVKARLHPLEHQVLYRAINRWLYER